MVQVVPRNGNGDPTVTPLNTAEREAVRRVLEYMRKPPQPVPTPTSEVVARFTVRLPAEARLYVNNVLVPINSATRTFNTPRLEPNRKYEYTLRMEIPRGDQPVSESRRVEFAAGQNVEVNFNNVATVQR